MSANGCAAWTVVDVLAVRCPDCGFILATVEQTAESQGWRVAAAPGWTEDARSGVYTRNVAKASQVKAVRLDKEHDGSARRRAIVMCECGADVQLDVSQGTIRVLLAGMVKV